MFAGVRHKGSVIDRPSDLQGTRLAWHKNPNWWDVLREVEHHVLAAR